MITDSIKFRLRIGDNPENKIEIKIYNNISSSLCKPKYRWTVFIICYDQGNVTSATNQSDNLADIVDTMCVNWNISNPHKIIYADVF